MTETKGIAETPKPPLPTSPSPQTQAEPSPHTPESTPGQTTESCSQQRPGPDCNVYLDTMTVDNAVMLLMNPLQAAQAFHNVRGPHVQCPKCGNNTHTRPVARRPGIYHCATCRSLFSIKTNTHIDYPAIKLTAWAIACYLKSKDPGYYQGATLAKLLPATKPGAARIEKTIESLRPPRADTNTIMRAISTVIRFTPALKHLRNPAPHIKDRPVATDQRLPYWGPPANEPYQPRQTSSSPKCPHCGAAGTTTDELGTRCVMCNKPAEPPQALTGENIIRNLDQYLQ